MTRGNRLLAQGARVAGVLSGDLNPWAVLRMPPQWTSKRWLPQVVVVACAVVFGTLAGGAMWQADLELSPVRIVLLGAAQGLPLVLCWYRPMMAFWLSLAASMLVSEVARADGVAPVWAEPSVLAHLCVLGFVACSVVPRVLPEMWVLTLLAGTILIQRMPPGYNVQDLVEMGTLSALVLIAGGAVRGRGEAKRRLAEQVRITATEQQRRAVLEERSRIARELHDVLAHHMSVIAIQAEAAPYRVANPPEQLTQGFATIRAHAQDALAELRRVLGVLRATDMGEESGPQPTLGHVTDLVAGARDAGLTVTTAVTGEPVPLPPGLELSAYRILQEGLNNAMRHAPGSEVRIEIAYHQGALHLRVINGPATRARAKSDGRGHGLLGMRERVGMLKGELTVGETPDGGYKVAAVLPLIKGEEG